MIREKNLSEWAVGRFRIRWFHQKNVGRFNIKKRVDRAGVGRSSKSGAAGNRQQLAKNVTVEHEPLRMDNNLRLEGSS